MVVDYTKGKIYKLVNDKSDDVYIGSSCQSLAKRIGGHRMYYKKYLEGDYHYITSSKLFENDSNVSIILIEEYPCSNKMELERRERYYIESIKCVNKFIPTRTMNEWFKDNKDSVIEYKKGYYENNKDEILERSKNRYEMNKEKILEKQKVKVKCDVCNKELCKPNLVKHKKTQH